MEGGLNQVDLVEQTAWDRESPAKPRGFDRSMLFRYGGALLSVLAATVLRLSVDPWVGFRFPLIAYFAALSVVAWFGGFGPTLAAIVLSGLAIPYFILEPRGRFVIQRTEDQIGFLSFLIVGGLMAVLAGSTRRSRLRAEIKAREAREEHDRLVQSIAEFARADQARVALLVEQRRLLVLTEEHSATIDDLFRQLPVGLALFGTDFRLQRVNPAVISIVGKPSEHWVGLGLDETLGPILGTGAAERFGETLTTGCPTTGSIRSRPFQEPGSDLVDIDWFLRRVDRPGGEVVGLLLTFVDVTEHIRRERDVRDVEERLRVTLGSIGEAVIAADPDGNVDYMNPVAEILTGCSLDDVRGKPLESIAPIREEIQNAFRTTPQPGRGTANHAFLIGRDGSERPIDYSAATIRGQDNRAGGVVLVFRDIQERREDEQALRESERRLLQLADTMPQIVWTAGSEGGIDYFNARWYGYTGLTPERSLSLEGWQAVIHPDEIAKFYAIRNRAVDDGALFEAEARLLDREGRYRWHLVRSQPILDDRGRVFRRFGTATDIDDRKQAEVTIRTSEQKFRRLAGALPQIVWTTGPDRAVEYYNERWYEYTGLTEEESFDPDCWQKTIHPDDIPGVVEARNRTDVTGEPFEAEFRLKDRTGAYRWFLGRAVDVCDDSGRMMMRFGTSTDIDDTKRAAHDARFLAQASEMLSTLVDAESTLQRVANLAVPFFADWCSVDLAVEGRGLRRLTVAHDDPKQAHIADLLLHRYPPHPDEPCGISAVMRTGQPELIPEVTEEMLVSIARDETHLRLLQEMGLKSSVCVPVKGRDGTIGVLTFASTESGRRYGPDDLRLAEDLAHRAAIAVENARLYEELRGNDRRKNEFLATLAHELRNPLAPIRNAIHLLDRDEPDAEVRREVRGIMRRQVEHMGRLVEDLLDMSRINQGKVDLRMQIVDLTAVVARSLEAARPLIEDQGHRLIVEIPKEEIALKADPTRLGQVLDNLLNNAAKYTDPGGLIHLSAERLGDEVEIRVRDSGIGVAQDKLSKIFDLFVQEERRMDRSRGGLGIGLSLVRRLVEMHGGSVSARSEGLGLGSEFLVRLPILSARPARTPQPPDSEKSKIPPLPVRRRVLIVDDNVDSARTMAMLLKRAWGQEVELAHDGPAAIEAARIFQPEMILLDIGLPGMSGYEVAEQLRSGPGFERVVIVAMTGWGQDEDRKRSREAGFDHHLVKPVDPEDLRKLLAEMVVHT